MIGDERESAKSLDKLTNRGWHYPADLLFAAKGGLRRTDRSQGGRAGFLLGSPGGQTMNVTAASSPGRRYSTSTRVIRIRQKAGSSAPAQYSIRYGTLAPILARVCWSVTKLATPATRMYPFPHSSVRGRQNSTFGLRSI